MSAAHPQPAEPTNNIHLLRESWVKVICKYPNLSGADVAVAVMLSTYINRNNQTAWPSIDTLAEDTNRDRRTVRRCVRRLEKLGLVDIVTGRGRHHSNRYRPKMGEHDLATLRRQGHTRNEKGVNSPPINKNTPQQADKPIKTCEKGVNSPPFKKGVNSSGKGGELAPQYSDDTLKVSKGTDFQKVDSEGFFKSPPPPGQPSPRIMAYDAFKSAPAGTLTVDAQIEKFRAYNGGRQMTADEWRLLWGKWIDQAVGFVRRCP